ncbi:MAG: 2-phosphoglycerate kinase, partial [Candidatus Krumholzibacteriia bacterium]
LVGGSTGSGKSTVATEVAHRLDITRIQSTDSVRHVMRSMISEQLLPSVHRSSFEAWKGSRLDRNPALDVTVAALLEQVQHVSVAVEAVLERAVQENLSTILEGVHLVPGLFKRFATDPRLQFIHLVVYVGDEEAHRQRFLRRGRTAVDRPGRRYLDNFDAIRTIQGYLVERAQGEGLPRIENCTLDDSVHAVLGHVLEGVADPTPIVAQRAR